MFNLFKRATPDTGERTGLEGRAGITDAILSAQLSAAQGLGTIGAANETAPVEFSVGLMARCFATAIVTPTMPGLTARGLAQMARTLLLTGNYVAAIEISRMGNLTLQPASSWDITGPPAEEDWNYWVDIPGPSRTYTRMLPYEGVVHIRLNASVSTPWQGVSPLESAGISAQLLLNLEQSMKYEGGSKTGFLLPIPEGLNDSTLTALRGDLAALKGGVALVETTASGLGQGRQNAPTADWKTSRFGPAFPEEVVEARMNVGANVCAALGIPSVLYTGGDGGGMREGYRQLLAASVQPIATIVTEELSLKLERPIALSFRRLAAADVAARARAYSSLIQAGVDPDIARLHAGLEE